MEELSAKYPERKLYTVDTLCASLGQGLLVWYAAQQRNKYETLLYSFLRLPSMGWRMLRMRWQAS